MMSLFISDGDCTRENITCSSLPAVSLKIQENENNLPSEMEGRIRYRNKLVIMRDGRYVFHIDEFDDVGSNSVIIIPSIAEQKYSCHSHVFSFQVVVHPQYSLD